LLHPASLPARGARSAQSVLRYILLSRISVFAPMGRRAGLGDG
jgi:hypothetical protein